MDAIDWIRLMNTPVPKTQAPMHIPKNAQQGKKNIKKGGKKK